MFYFVSVIQICSEFDCLRWIDLEPFEFASSNGTNSATNYYISDAQLCVEPCNKNGGKTSWKKADSACEVNS